MSAYGFVIVLHSWLRWAIIAFAVVLIARTTSGLSEHRAWNAGDTRAHIALVAATHLQATLGLYLYFVASPLVRLFLAAPGRAMKDSLLRFFGVEHLTGMLIAVVLVQLGRTFAKRATSDDQRFRRARGYTIAALVCIAITVPWPFFPYGRPLFRAG